MRWAMQWSENKAYKKKQNIQNSYFCCKVLSYALITFCFCYACEVICVKALCYALLKWATCVLKHAAHFAFRYGTIRTRFVSWFACELSAVRRYTSYICCVRQRSTAHANNLKRSLNIIDHVWHRVLHQLLWRQALAPSALCVGRHALADLQRMQRMDWMPPVVPKHASPEWCKRRAWMVLRPMFQIVFCC